MAETSEWCGCRCSKWVVANDMNCRFTVVVIGELHFVRCCCCCVFNESVPHQLGCIVVGKSYIDQN